MDSIVFAFPVNENNEITKEHFGEAPFFMIYQFSLEEKTFTFLQKRENITPEERMHGDTKKAKKILELLNNVHAFVGYAIGKNIQRIRMKVIPIKTSYVTIEENLQRLPALIPIILTELKHDPPYKTVFIKASSP